MSAITFNGVPAWRYPEISEYINRINIPVESALGIESYFILGLDRKGTHSSEPTSLDELIVEFVSPVKEIYRQKSNDVLRLLRRFIIDGNPNQLQTQV